MRKFLTTICALTYAIMSWAGAGFWGVQSLKAFINDGVATYAWETSGVDTIKLGTITKIELTEFTNNVWRDNNGNICKTYLHYWLHEVGDNAENWQKSSKSTWQSEDGNNQVWKNSSVNLKLMPEASGDYMLEIFFTATGSTSNNSDCTDKVIYASNGSKNYVFTFSVAEPEAPYVKLSVPAVVKVGESIAFDTLRTSNFTAVPSLEYKVLSPKAGATWVACTSPIVPDTIGTYKIAVAATHDTEIAHDTAAIDVKVDHYLTGKGAKLGSWSVNAIPMFGDSALVAVAEGDSLIFKVTDGTWENALGFSAIDSECSSRGYETDNDGNVQVVAKSAGEIKIKVADNKICVTGDIVAPFLGDWFQFKYGKTDGIDWLHIDLEADTIDNHFIADFTLPDADALDTLECYVAYNNGEGDPIWINDKSDKIFIKNIRNFSFSGDAGKLEIWKDSESTNWYLGFVSTVERDTTFAFKYGVADKHGWKAINFVADTIANHFIADYTMPDAEALDSLSCYVARSNGYGEPTWVDGMSETIKIDEIRGFTVAEDAGKLEIWKDSESANWYLGFVSNTEPDTTFAFKYGVAEKHGWNAINFVKDTIANRLVADYTIPNAEALDSLSCYVARSNGYGEPAWVEGMSETIKIDEIPGAIADQSGRLVIWSDSGSKNWYLAFEIDITSYTIAGDSVVLGSKWDINDASNNMIYDSDKDVWTLSKSNVELAAKSYDYKVVGNHNWSVYQLPAEGNQQLEIAEKGIYNVKFTFAPNAAEDKLTAQADKIGDLAPDSTTFSVEVPEGTAKCYVASNASGWSFEPMNKVDDTHYSLSIEAWSDTIEYKYACNNDWNYVEVDIEGNTIENRTWSANDIVARWAEEYILITSYTIVGDSVLLGSKWNTEDTNNDMIYDSDKDVWTLVKSNIELSAKNYDYKVVGNHNWDAFQLPAEGNQQLEIAERGAYNITFTFNPEAEENKLTAQADKIGDLAPDSTTFSVEVPEGTAKCYVASNASGWSFEVMNKVDDTHYSLSIEAWSDTLEYKYACNNDWNYVEVDAEGNAIENRTWSASDVVARWEKEVVIITSYTIVGDSLLTGRNWNTEEIANDMSYNEIEAQYTLTKENVGLAVGTYYYKLVANHAWGIKELPIIGNNVLEIEEAAYYDITFKFDAEKDSLWCVAEKLQAGEQKYEVVYGIEGEGGWQHVALVQVGESTEWKSAEITLPADISDYKCYVAYNNGIGEPQWVADKSLTVELSTINGASNEAKGNFRIYSDSFDFNWYLSFEIGSTTAVENTLVDNIYVHNERIYGSDDIRIYTVTGIDVTRMNGQLNGVYIVKCGENATKVVVK